MIALWICWLGIVFAIGAATYVWLTRGVVPYAMLVACVIAMDVSLRIYRRQGIFGG